MKAIPLTEKTYHTYAQWWLDRGQRPPQPGLRAVMLEHDGVLVSGAMLYTTDGPYLLAEHFAVSPDCPVTMAHRACKMTLGIVQGLCAMEGKVPMVLAEKKGIVKLLERVGYVRTGLGVFTLEEP